MHICRHTYNQIHGRTHQLFRAQIGIMLPCFIVKRGQEGARLQVVKHKKKR